VTFDWNYSGAPNNGVYMTRVVATSSENATPALGNGMPNSPTRSGYNFRGWNASSNGSGTAFSSATAVSGHIRVYAQWERQSNNNNRPRPTPTPSGDGGNTGGGNPGGGNGDGGSTGGSNPGEGNTGGGNPDEGNTGGGNPGESNTGGGNTGRGNAGGGNTGGGNTGGGNPDGGSVFNRYSPPAPSSGYLVPNDDGSFILFDESGTPLGAWTWDDDEEMWTFAPFETPLANLSLPRTGGWLRGPGSGVEIHNLLFFLSFVFMLGAIALHLSARRDKYYGKYQKYS